MAQTQTSLPTTIQVGVSLVTGKVDPAYDPGTGDFGFGLSTDAGTEIQTTDLSDMTHLRGYLGRRGNSSNGQIFPNQ